MGAQGFVIFGHELSLTSKGTHGNTPSRIKLDPLGSAINLISVPLRGRSDHQDEPVHVARFLTSGNEFYLVFSAEGGLY